MFRPFLDCCIIVAQNVNWRSLMIILGFTWAVLCLRLFGEIASEITKHILYPF